MTYGYARVSTLDQNLNLQVDALKKAGCEKILQEKISALKDRPKLTQLLNLLQQDDVLIVWKLDRLGRSMRELVQLVEGFNKKGVKFISLQDHIDTTTAQGRLFFGIIASLAEFERDLIRERTMAGLKAARLRGVSGGRKKGLSPEAYKKAQSAYRLYGDNSLSISSITDSLAISKKTLYNYVKIIEGEKKEASHPKALESSTKELQAARTFRNKGVQKTRK